MFVENKIVLFGGGYGQLHRGKTLMNKWSMGIVWFKFKIYRWVPKNHIEAQDVVRETVAALDAEDIPGARRDNRHWRESADTLRI